MNPPSPKKSHLPSILCWVGCILVVLAEAFFVFVVLPNGDRVAHVHPLGQLIQKPLNAAAISVATAGTITAVCALISMGTVVYLANQTHASKIGLGGAAIIGLLGMWQLNAANAIQDVLMLGQPTNKMAVAAFADLKAPSLSIVTALIVCLVWLATTPRKVKT